MGLLVHWSIGPLVHRFIGPLVHWSIGPLNVKCQLSNVICQISNVKNQMCNVNKVKLLSERTSGVPPVIFQLVSIVRFQMSFQIACLRKCLATLVAFVPCDDVLLYIQRPLFKIFSIHAFLYL